MKKVEQIKKDGKVVLREDNPLSRKELEKLLSSYFPLQYKDGHFMFSRDDKNYHILVKNITYLGHPHPVFKKRIQVSPKWKEVLKKENSFLLGVYQYKENTIFALFDKRPRGKSSSAHISTIDILKATESGIFQKVDKAGNNLIVFRGDKLDQVFNSLLLKKRIKNTVEMEVFDEFSNKLEKKWDGIKSYTEMIENSFSQAFQPEWSGFYLEYKFDIFLKKNKKYEDICRYIRDKKKSGLDFDIKFIQSNFFGDLKTHSETSGAVLGNDKRAVMHAINKYGKLWYVVFEVVPVKDSASKCKVSRFWNTKRNELQGAGKELESYCKKMKHSVTLTRFFILEINKFNQRYLSEFKQGRNTGGGVRAVKIKIDKKYIDNFTIHRRTF